MRCQLDATFASYRPLPGRQAGGGRRGSLTHAHDRRAYEPRTADPGSHEPPSSGARPLEPEPSEPRSNEEGRAGVSRWQVAFLRTALFWLVSAGAIGVTVAARPGLTGAWAPTHAHMATVGFFLAMVMGVAFWMLPRPGGIRQTEWEAATFVLLQLGLVARVAGEPWWRATGNAFAHVLFVASGVLVLASMLTFAWAMRKRIVTLDTLRAKGVRKRKGAA